MFTVSFRSSPLVIYKPLPENFIRQNTMKIKIRKYEQCDAKMLMD